MCNKKSEMRIVSTGQMRAQSISIQVSSRERCNAGCKFCISRTTFGVGDQNEKVKTCSDHRLRIGLRYARRLGATTAILTGKADPTQERDEYLFNLVRIANEYLPFVDMHTNGFLFKPGKSKEMLFPRLVDAGLSHITFSIASFDHETNKKLMGINQEPEKLIALALKFELHVRCSLVVNKAGVSNTPEILSYIERAGNLGAHAVVVREVWIPNSYKDRNETVYQWNMENRVLIAGLEEEFSKIASDPENRDGLHQRDPLAWGTPVFDVCGIFKNKNHGVNVTFARCDEATSGPVLKSIVHTPDGHGRRNWDEAGYCLY